MTRTLGCFLLALAVIAPGCRRGTEAPVAPVAEPSAPPPPSFDAIAPADNELGLRLFGQVRREDAKANLVLSPTSIGLALHMAYNGAVAETKQEMATALGLGDLPVERINEANAKLMADLKGADPKVQTSIANSIWIRKGYPFSESFLGICDRYYGARATELDFEKREAVETINGWVKEATGGKIDQMVDDSISRRLITLILISALYVDARWAEPFKEEEDHPGKFAAADGSETEVVMMSRTGRFRYLAGDGFQAIRLPYGSGRFGFYVLLPDRDSDLAALCAQLTSEHWEGWLNGMSEQEVLIRLPRFRVECSHDLAPYLEMLGMKRAFDPKRAQFDNLVPEPRSIWIDRAQHRVFLEVNEEGTQAGAATEVSFSEGAAAPGQLEMTVDRPFLCAIRDGTTGALVLFGAVCDPEAV